ncbi:hypothetical protein P152DRAFT_453828 [Eremomyces bilateralis CBS 781.70]|uniref:Pru domain-containing protein n=1 Tax=Eremomyces bilateralis CBS 781.70 TaxID=1392243 RepID=A0A6G1GGV5_9PEZI|nr:uncharacterized protein P152DRAFT_453828 [Eremomyces bilateralis CBS 781.70]KAF1817244.1 hypothetical protein P152DRAFT_453828 [Eremomyces bilateralis CBS 781.70]
MASITPLITFRAGKCEYDEGTQKFKAIPTPGFVYLYASDDLINFCWRPTSAPIDQPELELMMIPSDGTFWPYMDPVIKNPYENLTAGNVKSPTNGRIFVLKFSSSSQRHMFWMQSGGLRDQPSVFTKQDLFFGHVVNTLLVEGPDVDTQEMYREYKSGGNPPHGDEDENMEDAEQPEPQHDRRNSTGGAGPDATGGDVRDEGEDAREGGADGARARGATTAQSQAAPSDASQAVQNFLKSLNGGQAPPQQQGGKLYTTLNDLLPPSTTIPLIETASPDFIDRLSSHLPRTILLLEVGGEEMADIDPDSDVADAIVESIDTDQKREILRRVLRSPQLVQSLGVLTAALRDGGLPMISDALKLKVDNGGYVRGGTMPMGGGDAVEAFVEGVKKTAEGKGDEDVEMS